MQQKDDVQELWVPVRGIKLHIRRREGQEERVPFMLLHGLASNSLTWEPLARRLSEAGHPVVSVDQRGHGRSDKPDAGYGFDDFTADLHELLAALAWGRPPVIAGQSWGGAVAMEYAARYPAELCGLVLVDGGFGELAARPGATWERISVEMRPPNWEGKPRTELAERLHWLHPDWTEEGIENTLANFETLPDGTIRPWLTIERHMAILRALWDYHPSQMYSRITVPVLAMPAAGPDGARIDQKRAAIRVAEAKLPRCRVRWFSESDHDIHVQRPAELAAVIFQALADGFLCP